MKITNKNKSIKIKMTTENSKSKDELTTKDLAKIEKRKKKKYTKLLKNKQKKFAQNSEKTSNINENNLYNSEDTDKNDVKILAKKSTKSEILKSLSKETTSNSNEQKSKLNKNAKNSVQDVDKTQLILDVDATIFIGNLPVNTTRVHVQRLLKDCGSLRQVRFRSAGGKRIFKHKQKKAAGSLNAYVVFVNKEMAQNALKINGYEYKGRHLRATPLRMFENYPGQAKRTIFIGNLQYSANEDTLHEIFSRCGEIEYVRCLRDGDKGCKGVAYVCYKKPEAVGLALELNGTLLNDRPINVERYTIKKLGAKATRDATAKNANDKTSKTTQKTTKVNKKYKAMDKSPTLKKKNQNVESKKKKNFHGIKAGKVHKKKDTKKRKTKMQELAKKIAPKLKMET